MGARRVFLHVGAPKSGTTYLQARLAANAHALGRHGVLVPTFARLTPRPQAHFMAALDLLGQDWGGPPGHAHGSWPRLVAATAHATRSVVISHEILAPAPPPVVRRALADLGAGEREVHVVYTARDLAGALASAWQESIKQGRRWTFARFLDLAEKRRGWWYRALDLPTVLGTWSVDLPPERVHVVTVPPRGGQDDLWTRFCEAVGADPGWGPREPGVANRSLGVVEAQLLRRLNETTGRERADDRRAARITSLLEGGALEERRSPRIALPPDRSGWARTESERWAEWLASHPVRVHGSPTDLTPTSSPEPWTDPDAVDEALLLERAREVVVSLDRPTPGRRALAVRRVRRAGGLLRGNG
jgi:hypothetical protein